MDPVEEAEKIFKTSLFFFLVLFSLSFILLYCPVLSCTLLDKFLLSVYPIWFVILFPFCLGFLANFLPCYLGIKIHLYKVPYLELRVGSRNPLYYLVVLVDAILILFVVALGLISIFLFRKDLALLIIIDLARRKGYNLDYYVGNVVSFFRGLMYSGSLLPTVLLSRLELKKLRGY